MKTVRERVSPLTFGVIAFRFGPASPDLIPEARTQFYMGLAATVAAGPAIPVTEAEDRTLPLSLAELSGGFSGTETLAQKMLTRYRSWSTRPDVIIVDAMFGRHRAVPGRAHLQLAAAMLTFAEQWTDGPFVLLVDSVPPEGEAVRQVYEPLLDREKLVVIDREGQILGRALNESDLSRCYELLEDTIIADALRNLERKMIRRLGHFQRRIGDSDELECMRYFYDGERCIREVTTLLVHHVRKFAPDTEALFFDRSVSIWLEKAVYDAAIEMELVPVNFAEALEQPEVHAKDLSLVPLLILPLVDTGATVQVLEDKWIKVMQDRPFPRAVSILTTDQDASEGVREVAARGKKISVAYFLCVDRGLQRQRPCRMCDIGIPPTSHSTEHYQMVTAFDFWEMVFQAGWIAERNVPPKRTSLGYVPDFSRLFVENGAWLAEKALYRIARQLGITYETQPVVLVAPDEAGARTFAEYIALLHDTATIVLLPEEAIQLFRSGVHEAIDTALAQWAEEHPAWYAQLNEILAQSNIVIVEEFTHTGGSAQAIGKLMRVLRRGVKAHALICDFRPSKIPPGEPPRIALYQFDLRPQSA